MSLLRAVIRDLLAPPFATVTPAHRYELPADPSTIRLGRIPQSVVAGFEFAFADRDVDDLHDRLALVDEELRGFAYEGATMGCAVLDCLDPRRSARAARLMTGPGEPHLLLNYIGLGFAMARVPRRVWPRLYPSLGSTRLHPVMNWLAVDGYGFDLAYFSPDTYLTGQRRPDPHPWEGDSTYFHRAVDQGVGRAAWFAAGGDPRRTSRLIGSFDRSRRFDLWSGVGLAAAFAGPADRARPLLDAAGDHRGGLGIGVLFACEGRRQAGYVPEHTASMVDVVTGMSVDEAGSAIDAFQPADHEDRPGMPVYEQWRQALLGHLHHLA